MRLLKTERDGEKFILRDSLKSQKNNNSFYTCYRNENNEKFTTLIVFGKNIIKMLCFLWDIKMNEFSGILMYIYIIQYLYYENDK